MTLAFIPGRGQWVAFKALVPPAALERERAHGLPPAHRTADGYWVGVWDPGTHPGRTVVVNGVAEAPRPGRVVLVDRDGHDVLVPQAVGGRLDVVPVTFCLTELAECHPANDEDLPPGRPRNPIRRPRHERPRQ